MRENNADETGQDASDSDSLGQSESRMDDFTQFQLKEYDNISQAHFKTNEMLATFYRYFLLITAIPITTISLALVNLARFGIGEDGRILAYLFSGTSAVLLSLVGIAVIAYIEGLRLDAILYARAVNSIRDYFFKKNGASVFGEPVLPRHRDKPSYDGFGASFIMYFACAFVNAMYFAAGILVLKLETSVPLAKAEVSECQLTIAVGCILFLMVVQILIRNRLVSDKSKKGF